MWDFARLDAYRAYIDAVLPSETDSNLPNPSPYHKGEEPNLDEEESATPTPRPPMPPWLHPAKARKFTELNYKVPKFQAYSESPSHRSPSPSSTTISSATVSISTNPNRSSSRPADTSNTPDTEQSNPFDPRTLIAVQDLKRSKRHWDEMYGTAYKDRWRLLRAHKIVTIPVYDFTGRQMAWDSNGEWCVVSGSENVIAVCGR